ncbi:MAG: YggS family pyridoxal phosphate-dependent enzyme [Solirubrobacterales bacterium]
MAPLSADAPTIAANLDRVRSRIDAACERVGRSPGSVSICAATKYVAAERMAPLLEVGVRIAGENRLQDLIVKQDRFADSFEWHFIGAIQSRKVREIASRVSTIHSLGTESARDRLAAFDGPTPRVLIQVNIAAEQSKQGVAPEALADFIAGCPIPVAGLMTMPPLAPQPEDARPHFRALATLAAEHGLKELSMGTSQDFEIAVEEGATIVRLGSVLFAAN